MEQKQTEKSIQGQELFYWLQTITIPLVCIVLIFTFLGRITCVVGSSMDPTLEEGELMLVWSLGYQPTQGDVVIASIPSAAVLDGEAIVKRVIATEGQTVSIDYSANTVTVDGTVLDEPYILERMRQIYGESTTTVTYEIPEDYVFLMGDNRNGSNDSRNSQVGAVHEDCILGTAVLAVYPLDKFGLINQ